MLTVTRLDGQPMVLNAELIESIEAVPDTVIAMTNHKRFLVRETVSVVMERVIAYQRAVRGPGEDGVLPVLATAQVFDQIHASGR